MDANTLQGIINLVGMSAGNLDSSGLTKDKTKYSNEIQLNNHFSSTNDYDSLTNNFSNLKLNTNNYTQSDLWNSNNWKSAANMFKDATTGALSGAAAGPVGAIVGAVAGLGTGAYKWIKGATDAKNKADELNKEQNEAKNAALYSAQNNAFNISNDTFNKAVMGIKKNGGSLNTYDLYKLSTLTPYKIKDKKLQYRGYGNINAFGGDLNQSGDWSNNVKIISEGGTHEENKYGGVPLGVSIDGVPNLVEEGEVVFNDYVFSNRLFPSKGQLESIKLPRKYNGKTYAEIAKDMQKESAEMPNDPIAKNSLLDNMGKLMAIQEETRELESAKNFNNAINKDINVFKGGGKTNTDKTNTDKTNTDKTNTDWLRYASVIGSAGQVLSDTFNLTNQYDYSNADYIKQGINNIKDYSYTPVNGHIDYTPIDLSYLDSKILNTGLSSQRAVQNSSSNNGAAITNLLALNNNITQQRGDNYFKTRQYNEELRNKSTQFNTNIQQINSQLQAQTNQLNAQSAAQRLQGLSNYAQFRDSIDTAVSSARSANWNNLIQNLNNIGREKEEGNLIIEFLKNNGLYEQYMDYINNTKNK